ncbi:cbb3-type cytochrome c oxidase subunit I [Paucilactobacillus hokkaidonensis]|uniref:cbb3-type cytochrome c oxidase subunit I n=1 Tax=Paucilactobacillus hokkaidonensis TaxID=1193095 RepID=UPI000A68593B
MEGIFESFAVILIGYLMVDLKLTTIKSTIRALYFQLVLLLGSGVIGMGHHYFWEGDHSIWLALGACFSAMEVVPLCLLIWEAWTHYRVVRDSGVVFPYKPTFTFLAWTGIWNVIGAGALGFLINAPAINYFEHGTQWTSAHAHTSMAGVYGMLSLASCCLSCGMSLKRKFGHLN